MFVFCAIAAARAATSCASFCGVVTTRTSARGSSWPSEIETSPVPGRHVHDEQVDLAPVDVRQELLEGAVEHRPAPHHGLVAALEEEADRHQLQVVLHRRHDQLVHGTRPLADAEDVRDRVASRCPRRARRRWCPLCEKATARFAASEDLPTPPLPLATASTRQSLGSRITPSRSGAPPRSFCVSACRSSGVITSKESSTPVTPRDARERLLHLLLERVAQRAAGAR
jgi:hypothetical protein